MEVKELSILNPEFAELITQLNTSINHVSRQICEGKFAHGDINLKLSIGTITEFIDVSEDGDVTSKPYEMPVFEFKIGINLQKKSNISGSYTAKNKEFEIMDNQVVLRELQSAQMSMY